MKKMGEQSYSKKISALKNQKAKTKEIIAEHERTISKQKEKLKQIDLEILSLVMTHANISAENAADMIDEKLREIKKTILNETDNNYPDEREYIHDHTYGGKTNEY